MAIVQTEMSEPT